MRLLFGKDTREPIKEIKVNKQPIWESENIKKNKNFLYLKEYQEVFLSQDLTPRYNMKTDHPVEQFYKRHMNND